MTRICLVATKSNQNGKKSLVLVQVSTHCADKASEWEAKAFTPHHMCGCSFCDTTILLALERPIFDAWLYALIVVLLLGDRLLVSSGILNRRPLDDGLEVPAREG